MASDPCRTKDVTVRLRPVQFDVVLRATADWILYAQGALQVCYDRELAERINIAEEALARMRERERKT